MRIPLAELRPGDILLFKGRGPLFEILSRLLKLFEPKYDRWAWHAAVVVWGDKFGWWMVEAIGVGVTLTRLNTAITNSGEPRAYRWLDAEPDKTKVKQFIKDRLNKGYDAKLYIWALAYYLARRFFKYRIPRIIDDSNFCWELVVEAMEYFGKPIISIYETPILTDILKAVGGITRSARSR